jgi:hypothetical protein
MLQSPAGWRWNDIFAPIAGRVVKNLRQLCCGKRLAESAKGDVQAFAPVLMLLLKRKALFTKEVEMASNPTAGLVFQIDNQGLERDQIEGFMFARAGSPIHGAEAAGEDDLFLFEFGQLRHIAFGNGSEFANEDFNSFPEEIDFFVGIREWVQGDGL